MKNHIIGKPIILRLILKKKRHQSFGNNSSPKSGRSLGHLLVCQASIRLSGKKIARSSFRRVKVAAKMPHPQAQIVPVHKHAKKLVALFWCNSLFCLGENLLIIVSAQNLNELSIITFPETNMQQPETGWLEYHPFLLGFGLFSRCFFCQFQAVYTVYFRFSAYCAENLQTSNQLTLEFFLGGFIANTDKWI